MNSKEAVEELKEIKQEIENYKSSIKTLNDDAKQILEEFKFDGGCGNFYWNKNIRKDKKIRCQTNHLCPSCQAKKEIKKIWKDLK